MTKEKWINMTDREREDYANSPEGERALLVAAFNDCPQHFCPKCGVPVRNGFDHNPYCCDKD